MTKEFYIPSLDGIRAIAFLLVFVAHSGLDNVVPGGFGVTVFFFLSGYLITSILRIELEKTGTISLSQFYLRRAFRILPPLYVTLALGYLLGTTGILREQGNWFGLFAVSAYFFNYTDLLHLPAVVPTGTGVVWSLMVEEHFYFAFPFLFRALVHRRLTRKAQGAVLLALCALALTWRLVLVYYLHSPTTGLPRWTYSASDARFDSILFGCLLAICNNVSAGDHSPFLEKWKGALASAALAGLVFSLLFRNPIFRETFRYTLQSICLYPIFFYCISSSHRWQVSWLEWKPLRWIGWTSYAMYLFHFIPLGIGQMRFPQHPVLVSIAAFVLSLLYSWAIRVWVERPSRALRGTVESRLSGASNRTLTPAG